MLRLLDFFRFDNLSVFVGIFVGVFSLLIILYSFGFMRGRKGLTKYYLYIILTFVGALGAVFSNNLVLFMAFWGFLGLTLYLLIGLEDKSRTQATAKKALIIIGGSDAFMLLGLALVWRLAGTLNMDKMSIALNSKAAVWAYLCFAAGAFAKAGAMPLHTWIPDTAEDAPTPVTAYLPASLDKLLGIYFLVRISVSMFQMNSAMNTFLMFIGSFTIVAAVMMALIQHDLKRLLGYHAVSQVGYMVLGIGTGNPIGIAGGLFHMLNHAIYKSCLFLSGGAVEKKAGTTNLEKLGGFARIMPVTFITFLIASFAISGVPPFNGFASKWMVYQGVIESGKSGGYLWVVWLVAALFGSALTLASFMKAVHTVFLGQSSKKQKVKDKKQETSITMLIPIVILASLCVIFGVFAYQVPLKLFIFPSLNIKKPMFTGIWSSGLATGLLILAIIVGFIIYLIGLATKARTVEPFVGGEVLEKQPDMRVSGADFYDTIRDIGILRTIYGWAEKKVFDIYDQLRNVCSVFTNVLRTVHTGVLTTYLLWVLAGIAILLAVLLVKL